MCGKWWRTLLQFEPIVIFGVSISSGNPSDLFLWEHNVTESPSGSLLTVHWVNSRWCLSVTGNCLVNQRKSSTLRSILSVSCSACTVYSKKAHQSRLIYYLVSVLSISNVFKRFSGSAFQRVFVWPFFEAALKCDPYTAKTNELLDFLKCLEFWILFWIFCLDLFTYSP